MKMNHDSFHYKFGEQKKVDNVNESYLYKDMYILPNGTQQHALLEICIAGVMKDLACSKEEARSAVKATVHAVWRIKTWNL